MNGFEDAHAIVIGHEKGYSNRDLKADPGGETMYGVTARVARAWGYQGPMKDLPFATAKAIAKREYWDKYHCDQFPPLIGFQVFDTVYNGGLAIKWLQESVGVDADGKVGAKTVLAVRNADTARTIARFNAKRLLWLCDRKNWHDNSRGWARRVAANLLLGVA